MPNIKGHKQSEKFLEAQRAKARKPRGKWAGTHEREWLEQAKSDLRKAMPDAARRLVAILASEDTPDEIFMQAFKLAADRAGLVATTDITTNGEAIMAPLVVVLGSDEA